MKNKRGKVVIQVKLEVILEGKFFLGHDTTDKQLKVGAQVLFSMG